VLSELVERDIIAPATELEHYIVSVAQRKLRLEPTGELDAATQAALRGVQRFWGLVAHGHLDRATAVRLDRMTGPMDDGPPAEPEK
jgi:hypothetical protein